ncbi:MULTISPECIES: cytochrome P460 family protein [unclassified Myroides]|uniref:cytochrome P460 family protein n=1 Tax=unclassified Myroides TaxID=2642485 RepID=UPI003D2F76E3
MKKVSLGLLILAVCIGFIQLIKPQELEYKAINDLTGLPKEVNAIIRNSCFDCHSKATNLRWYDKFTPVNFLVDEHVRKGRAVLDFSTWDSLSTVEQNGKLYYALNKILAKEMPLLSYTAIHREAKLSEEDLLVFKKYLLTRTPRKQFDNTQMSQVDKQFSDLFSQNNGALKNAVSPVANGIAYIPDYQNWSAISITDRFDNGTMRIIYGNDIVVEAIKKGTVNPWPDGAILAKAGWKQMTNPDGTISTGEFAQVEFMIKDAKKYAQTAGWGWARWKGIELKPYGQNESFTRECISCHTPVKEMDYTFTKPIFLTNLF